MSAEDVKKFIETYKVNISGLKLEMAKKIPAGVRKTILEEKFIDKAVNTEARNSPMEYLFDVFEEFIDVRGEHNDWYCFLCRDYILAKFKGLKPILEILQKEEDAIS